MVKPNYQTIIDSMIGDTVPAPASGTLSGHAAGEPFDKEVYNILKEKYPDTVFRQFEYLNKLYLDHPGVTGVKRFDLFDSKAAKFLLKRGVDETENWSPEHQFEEKQNDTADNLIVYYENNHIKYDIVDIKTRNNSKKAQSPNIISALKLAEMCKIMIDANEFDRISLNYIEIDWSKEGSILKCTNGHYANLFKSDPRKLYINWSAALQIQFHVCDLPQNYNGTMQEWCHSYLVHFVQSARKRIKDMEIKMIEPYQDYMVIDTGTIKID